MCGWCLAYCTGVVLNTVRESAMPDSKENKQADAGSRRFRRHFLCGALLCNFLSTEHEGLSTHVQWEWSAEHFMPSILSLRIFCTAVLSRCKFSHPTVCVCVVFSSRSFWTSTSLDVPARVTQEEGHTGFLIHLSAVRALTFLARRIQPFLSLVDREVELCVLTILLFSTRWAFLFLFFIEKNPVCRDRTHVPTCRKVTRYL